MKKILLSFLALMMLTACSNKNKETTEEIDPIVETITPEPKEIPDPYPLAENDTVDEPLTEDEEIHLSVAEEYPSLDIDNIYYPLSYDEVKEFLTNGSGILYLSDSDDDWSQFFAFELNFSTQAAGMTAYIYNPINDIKNGSDLSQKLQEIVGEDSELNLPLVLYLQNGEIVNLISGNHSDESGGPQEYWTAELTDNLRTELYNLAINMQK